MSSKPTQDKRMAELTTPLGKDKLVLTRFDIAEGLSELFEIGVDCVSPDENLDFNAAIGLNCAVRLRTVGKKTRYFNGVLVEASWSGEQQAMYAYRLVLRPWTWLLSQAVNSKIFQNKSVIDVIKEVFDKAGFNDYDFKNSESYDPIEYCVQYNETHLNFVSRLMEQFGLYYYFKHTADKHVMVITDSKSTHTAIPDLPKVTFIGAGERTRDDKEFLRDWTSERRFRTGKVTVKAFDFDKPTSKIEKEESSPGGYNKGDMEVFHYPEKMKQGQESSFGAKYASAVLQAAQSEDRRRYAGGDAPSIFPGGLVTLEKHKTPAENQEYLVVRASHSFIGEAYKSGAGGGTADSYNGAYVLQPKDRQFRAPLLTPRPVIYGPQTAEVVGPSGEEIHTDEHGRVKLKFHWDRIGKRDEKASRWVRVAQMYSGKKWGGFYVPRIGMEAVVEFIEGDPDRPLVVGTVYNGDNKLPQDMPANKTQHGMKTRSSKGGSDSTYNELVFEDKKGSEFVRFHAEKDLDSTIEDTEKRLIKGKNRKGPGDRARETIIEKGDDRLEIKDGDLDIDVSNEVRIHAGKKIVLTVGFGKTLSRIEMTPQSISVSTLTMNTKTDLATNIDGGVTLNQKAGIININ